MTLYQPNSVVSCVISDLRSSPASAYWSTGGSTLSGSGVQELGGAVLTPRYNTTALNNGSPQALNKGSPQALNKGSPRALNKGSPQALNKGSPQALNKGSPQRPLTNLRIKTP